MRNIIFISTYEFSKDDVMKIITDNDVMKIIADNDGDWVYDAEMSEGVITDSNEGAIFITAVDNFLDYETSELKRYSRLLGDHVRGGIDIHIGNSIGSLKLARKFSELLMLNYCGVIDYDAVGERSWKDLNNE